MKATELRVNNLVLTGGNEQYVVSIDIDDPQDPRINDCQEIAYQPIPLTEEWLVRFGYSDTNDEMYNVNIWMLGDDIHVSPVVSSTGIHGLLIYGYLKYFEDVYVHQLQNLYFALTGEELTTK